MQVWKFVLEITDEQTIAMPLGAEILEVGSQFDRLCIWAIVDPDAGRTDRRFLIAGTGNPIRVRPMRHLGSAVTMNGLLVWHVFEVWE